MSVLVLAALQDEVVCLYRFWRASHNVLANEREPVCGRFWPKPFYDLHQLLLRRVGARLAAIRGVHLEFPPVLLLLREKLCPCSI